jgi:hypothetical protein
LRAEEPRELPDQVLEVRVMIRVGFRHLDHVQEITGHGSPFVDDSYYVARSI